MVSERIAQALLRLAARAGFVEEAVDTHARLV